MKRFIAIILALMLCVPCALAQGLDEELTGVTLTVKERLGIGDHYTDFTSSNYEDRWELYWSDGSDELSVTCDADGVIYSYYLYDYGFAYDDDYTPRYPDVDADMLKNTADEFLGRVITAEGQGWTLNEMESTLMNGGYSRVTLSGRLTMLGEPTDIEISITIDIGSGRVVSYYRSDNYSDYSEFSGDMSMAMDDEEARSLLNNMYWLNLEYYVLDSGEMARLVYRPASSERYVVRASDGTAIDLNAAYGYGYDVTEAASAKGGDYGADSALTDVEIENIGVYKNALPADELDIKLRSMPELGLTDDYYLANTNYRSENGRVVADMSYSRQLSEEEVEQRGLTGECHDEKSFTVSAEDGRPINLYSYYPGYRNTSSGADEVELAGEAFMFIHNYYPEYSGNIELESTHINEYSYSWERNVTANYVRVHNGYRFRANSISVTVNSDNGTIDSLHIYWDDNQEFFEPSEEEIISYETAHEAYLGGFEFERAFISIPGNRISDWEYEFDLTYAWQYRNVENIYAIDAVTGEIYTYSEDEDVFEYGDIAGHVNEAEIAKLGRYGIGFPGGEFLPDAPFTATDALVMINQAPDYGNIYAVEARDFDALKDYAYAMGATGLEDMDADKQLTRVEFARVLLGMSGYGKAIALPGIYSCGFADDADIAAEDYPVVAIAYALGLIATDENGNINAYEPLDRADGAVIFHNLLSLK